MSDLPTDETVDTEDFTEATEVDHETQEEIEGEEAEATEEEEGELEYYQIGDIEATADEISKWKEAHNKKRDTDKAWTEKTQKLSAERKEFETKRSQFEPALELFESMESDIQKAIAGDLDDKELARVLEEEGAEAHLKLKAQMEQRKGVYAEIKQKHEQVKREHLQAAFQELHSSLGWSDSDKQKADIEGIGKYVNDAGITQEEYNRVTNPKIMRALLEAGKYRELMKKTETTKKKVVKAPKVTKPSASKQSKPLSLAERMYGKKT